MVNEELFDNKYVMDFNEALDLIKSYFRINYPMFTIIEEYNKSSGYWGVKFSYKDVVVFISCGRGYLENEIIINGEGVSLMGFEPLMENVEVASNRNIAFSLGVIKRILQNTLG